MALYVTNSSNSRSNVDVSGTQVPPGNFCVSSSASDFVSLGSYCAADIHCNDQNGPVAVHLSTGVTSSPTNMQTFSSYTQSAYQVYYNRSYRWQVNSTGGSIGIRI